MEEFFQSGSQTFLSLQQKIRFPFYLKIFFLTFCIVWEEIQIGHHSGKFFPPLTLKIKPKSAWTLSVYWTEREGGGENNFSRNKNSYFNLPEQIKLSWKLILTIFSSPGIRTQTEIIRKVCFQIYYTFLALFFAFLCVYLNTFARTLSKQVYNTASYQRKNKLHRFFRLLFQWILFYFFIFFRISFQ